MRVRSLTVSETASVFRARRGSVTLDASGVTIERDTPLRRFGLTWDDYLGDLSPREHFRWDEVGELWIELPAVSRWTRRVGLLLSAVSGTSSSAPSSRMSLAVVGAASSVRADLGLPDGRPDGPRARRTVLAVTDALTRIGRLELLGDTELVPVLLEVAGSARGVFRTADGHQRDVDRRVAALLARAASGHDGR